MTLCQYRDLFGKPGEGGHSYRIGSSKYNFAIVDILSTILGAWIIHYFILGKLLGIHSISIWWILAGLFILGIILHRVFCVRTTLDKILFPSV